MDNKEHLNDYQQKANTYAKHEIEGTVKLAYQEFGRLFDTYVEGKNALDYGSGTGRSTRYLKKVGFFPEGVDINPAMLTQAKEEDKESNEENSYELVNNNKIPKRDAKFDLTFCTFVLFEIPTLDEMKKVFEEVYRVMKFNGAFIILTVNDDFYKHDWVSVSTNYPENINPKSGDIVKIKIKAIDLELKDYYWTQADYEKVIKETGFSVVEKIMSKADPNDQNNKWISEIDHPPYVTYVLKKTKALTLASSFALERNLSLIPKQGYFKEIERSKNIIPKDKLENKFNGDRNEFATIELLMEVGQMWPFHSLLSDELFKYIEGRDMTIHVITPSGKYSKVLLGKEDENAVKEYNVPGGHWYAEEVTGSNGYSLVHATTKPGFHPDDAKQASEAELVELVKDNDQAVQTVQRFMQR